MANRWMIGGRGRGQSSPVALVLIIGLVVAGTTVVIVAGGMAITDTQDRLESENAKNAMTQLSSDVSLVATEGAGMQSTTLPADGGGSYNLNESAGKLTVTARNETDSTELLTTELGKVTYTNSDSTIAYQGGGVWRGGDGSATMVSPPDVFYRNGTLTVQPTNITGKVSSGGEVTIRKANTADAARSLHGNLEDRNVYLKVQSEYYRAWGQYFDTRTNSEPAYFPSNNTVRTKLVAPKTSVKIDAGIVSSGNLTVNSNGGDVVGPVSLGGVKKGSGSVTSNSIEENQSENEELEEASSKIASAESRLSSESGPGSGEVTAGDYHVSNDDMFDSERTFNTENGDINLYVDGNVKPDDLTIIGDNDVNIYIDGTLKMKGQVIWGDSSKIESLTVYSKDVERITELYGVVYTDAVSIKGNGQGDGLTGALISTADNTELGGNAEVTYDSSLGDRTLAEVQPKYATILYLHVSESRVRLD